MNYANYHFTFAVLNKTDSRRFKFTRYPGFISLRLRILCLTWEVK